jgi:hypothetical protein
VSESSGRPPDQGSVLILVPAGILVLLVLASIAVDSALVHFAQRDLANRTAAAGNDIAGLAVDDAAFYDEDGTITLDQERADAYIRLAFAPERLPDGYSSWSAVAETRGNSVIVSAEAEVDLIFSKAIPGVAHAARVEARSLASARGE